MNMDMHSLFPVAVGRVKIDITDSERDILLTESGFNRANIGNRTSLNHKVLDRDDLSGLKDRITMELNSYFKSIYAPAAEVELYITQSWLNVTRGGEFHHKHTHPGSLLSAVFYVDTTEADKIVFSKQGHNTLDFPPAEFNQFNSPTWWLPANRYDLLIFPSSLEHHVPTVEPENVRISLALNTWFYGEAGAAGDMTLLEMIKQ